MAAFPGKSRITNGGANDLAILNSFYNFPGTVGNIIHVYSGGLGTATGVTVTDAALTMVAGQTLATADNGDLVLVLPGHTESVVGAASAGVWTFSKAGVTYRGVGSGRGRPTITFGTGTDAQMIVSAARVTFQNLVFDFGGFDQIVAAISVTGVDVAFEDCEFLLDNGTNKSVILGILTAATASRLRIERCRFIGTPAATATVTAAIKHEVGADYVIKDCYFEGKMTQAILNATTLLRGLIDSNRFVIGTGTVAITMAAASTPFIVNNRINVASGTAPIVAAAGFMAGNVYSAAVGVTAGTASTF